VDRGARVLREGRGWPVRVRRPHRARRRAAAQHLGRPALRGTATRVRLPRRGDPSAAWRVWATSGRRLRGRGGRERWWPGRRVHAADALSGHARLPSRRSPCFTAGSGVAVLRREIIIVGSGPAGAATALGIAARSPALAAGTTMLERAIHPRDKTC